MRFMEIANPEDQLALWRLVSDKMWGAFAQQPVQSKNLKRLLPQCVRHLAQGRALRLPAQG